VVQGFGFSFQGKNKKDPFQEYIYIFLLYGENVKITIKKLWKFQP